MRKAILSTSVAIMVSAWINGCLAATVTITADDWYPVTAAKDGERTGFLIEIAKEIFKENNTEVIYKVQPWERAMASVRGQQMNCVAGAYKSDAPDFLYPEKAQGMDSTSFFIRKEDSWRYEGIDSLNKVKLGIIGGYSYDGGDLDAYIAANSKTGKIQTISANQGLEQNIQKLLAGRIDVVIESAAVFSSKASDLGLSDKFISAGNLAEPQALYIACGPNDPNNQTYVKLLSEGMSKLKQSGKLQEILSHYNLTLWKDLDKTL